MAMQQRTIRFHGDVQGVGFRYTACRTASGHDVTGYVRNMPDGSVECVVEGEAAEIDAFLESLARRMARHIHRRTEQIAPYTGRFNSFGVEF
jgi:acylphosphatase